MKSLAPSLGDRIGPYALGQELGTGGTATVFRATHVELGREVAIKLLAPEVAAHPNAPKRLRREARIVAALRHPHIVHPLDVGTWRGRPYLVIELLDGLTLQQYLAAEGALSVERAVDLLIPVLSAVSLAHAHGVVHRDLKPSNILLPRVGARLHPKVVDFGIAKRDDASDEALTRSDAILGTPQYMAPEQLCGAQRATAQSDQYALGVVLYECVAGKLPFAGGPTRETIVSVMTGSVPALRSLRAAVPPEFDAIVLRAIAREPANRFPSVHALGRTLLPFASAAVAAAWSDEFGAAPFEVPSCDGNTLREPGAPRLTRSALVARKSERLRWPLVVGVGAALVSLAVVAGVPAAEAGRTGTLGARRAQVERAPKTCVDGLDIVVSSSRAGAAVDPSDTVRAPKATARAAPAPAPARSSSDARGAWTADGGGVSAPAPSRAASGTNQAPILE